MFLYKIQDHYFCLKLSNWLATGKISFDSDVAEKKKKYRKFFTHLADVTD